MPWHRVGCLSSEGKTATNGWKLKRGGFSCILIFLRTRFREIMTSYYEYYRWEYESSSFLTPKPICRNTQLGCKGMQLRGFLHLAGNSRAGGGQGMWRAGALFFWVLAQDLTSASGDKVTQTEGTSDVIPASIHNKGVKKSPTLPLSCVILVQLLSVSGLL